MHDYNGSQTRGLAAKIPFTGYLFVQGFNDSLNVVAVGQEDQCGSNVLHTWQGGSKLRAYNTGPWGSCIPAWLTHLIALCKHMESCMPITQAVW
jgi:hypothetical protein